MTPGGYCGNRTQSSTASRTDAQAFHDPVGEGGPRSRLKKIFWDTEFTVGFPALHR